MDYISTRGGIKPVSFHDAVMMGLARDGGLLLPAAIPDVSSHLKDWRQLSYTDLAIQVMRLFVDIPAADFDRLVRKSYATFDSPEIAPVQAVDGVHIVELFHGPTLAFKDVALQFLGNLFEYVLKENGQELNILAATSGDTGSAAIHGVRGRDRIRIFVMHPHGRVSAVQERQMTSVLDENVHNLAIEGTFDDCQRIMKTIFGDLAFKDRYSLGSVNSINWARVLAQIVYYFYAAFRVMDRTGAGRVRFSVPTGNFGNIFAGYVAARMGLPISRLVLATNENDILARYFQSGDYSLGQVYPTLSPSMDIQVASNFERYLYYRCGEKPQVLAELMKDFGRKGQLTAAAVGGCGPETFIEAGSGNSAATIDTIRRFYKDYGYLLDPHSAVGVSVGARYLDASEPMICLATAHPAKFGQAIQEATGQDIARHPFIDRLKDLPTRCTVLPASEGSVRDFMEKQIADTSV